MQSVTNKLKGFSGEFKANLLLPIIPKNFLSAYVIFYLLSCLFLNDLQLQQFLFFFFFERYLINSD